VLDQCTNPSDAASPDAFCENFLTFRDVKDGQKDDSVIRETLEALQPPPTDYRATVSPEAVTGVSALPRGSCTGTLLPGGSAPSTAAPTTAALPTSSPAAASTPSPTAFPTALPTAASVENYARVADQKDCCRFNGAKIRGFKRRPSPEDCEASCDRRSECRFYSHSTRYHGGLCILCEACEFSGAPGNGRHYTSWAKLDNAKLDNADNAALAVGGAIPTVDLSSADLVDGSTQFESNGTWVGEGDDGDGDGGAPGASGARQGVVEQPALVAAIAAAVGVVSLLLIGACVYARRGKMQASRAAAASKVAPATPQQGAFAA